jgi:hypothetical protein
LKPKPVPPSSAELRRKISMKRPQLLSLAIASVFVINSSRAATLDDVQFWVGSGANSAALVIDWNDGKSAESLLWGYRWDGSATGLDMFQAVVNADSRLFAHLSTFSFGTSILGIGYDLNNNGAFGVTPSLNFDAGGLVVEAGSGNALDARVATDNADHFIEGWNSGFWAYYTKGASSEAWASASAGAGDRVLVNGAWDGFSFALNFSGPEPGEPFAAVVPEPSALALLFLGAGTLLFLRKRRATSI